MDVSFIQQIDVFCGAVVPAENLDIIVLKAPGFLHDSIIFPCNALGEELLPFGIGKSIAIEQLQLRAQVGNKRLFAVYRKVFIPLRGEQADELLFQRRLALVGVGLARLRRVFRHDGVFRCLGDDVVTIHRYPPYCPEASRRSRRSVSRSP